jgi:hypothetical protein
MKRRWPPKTLIMRAAEWSVCVHHKDKSGLAAGLNLGMHMPGDMRSRIRFTSCFSTESHSISAASTSHYHSPSDVSARRRNVAIAPIRNAGMAPAWSPAIRNACHCELRHFARTEPCGHSCGGRGSVARRVGWDIWDSGLQVSPEAPDASRGLVASHLGTFAKHQSGGVVPERRVREGLNA